MKRKRASHSDLCARKQARLNPSGSITQAVECSPLRTYYTRVQSLRAYLLSRLSGASKRRRRLVAQAGHAGNASVSEITIEDPLASLLDHTMVGSFNDIQENEAKDRLKDAEIFSQQLGPSTSSTILSQASTSQSDVGPPYIIYSSQSIAHSPRFIYEASDL